MSVGEIPVPEQCYLCKAPFQPGERIVAKCKHVMHEECWEENLGFAGSVAAVFSTQLESACLAEGLRSPKILRSPIDELVKLYL